MVWTVIEKNARVEMRGAVGSGAVYHSFYLTLSSSSKIKGDQINLYSHDMNIAGDITGTSKIVLNSAVVAWPQDNKDASDQSTLLINDASSLSCSRCEVAIAYNGTATIKGDISCG